MKLPSSTVAMVMASGLASTTFARRRSDSSSSRTASRCSVMSCTRTSSTASPCTSRRVARTSTSLSTPAGVRMVRSYWWTPPAAIAGPSRAARSSALRQKPISSVVRPITSARGRPARWQNASFASMTRPSAIDVTTVASGES
jgi:hypothetical protein